MEVILVNSFIINDSPLTSGNPTMICLVNEREDHLMSDEVTLQMIASEMNQSVTAFVSINNNNKLDDSKKELEKEAMTFSNSSHFSIRWYSPTCEANICGHGTLAAGHVLWQLYNNRHSTLFFHTKYCGIIQTNISDNKNDITISLPAAYSVSSNEKDFSKLIQIIIGDKFTIFDVHYCKESYRLLLRLPDGTSRKQLESLTVDTSELMKVEQNDVKGIIVTIKCNDESSGEEEGRKYGFYSRYFAPWWGNSEDHVTGASHTTLVPYWSSKLGKDTAEPLYSCQCSPKRGGELIGTMDDKEERVLLTGRASIVMRGQLLVK